MVRYYNDRSGKRHGRTNAHAQYHDANDLGLKSKQLPIEHIVH